MSVISLILTLLMMSVPAHNEYLSFYSDGYALFIERVPAAHYGKLSQIESEIRKLRQTKINGELVPAKSIGDIRADGVSLTRLCRYALSLHNCFGEKHLIDEPECQQELFIEGRLFEFDRYQPLDVAHTKTEDIDPKTKKIMDQVSIPSSGNFLADRLADLCKVTGSLESAQALMNSQSLRFIDEFVYRQIENAIPWKDRYKAAQLEWFHNDFMSAQGNVSQVEAVLFPPHMRRKPA